MEEITPVPHTAASCKFCGERLFRPGGPAARKPHCRNPQCDWCLSCFAETQKAARGDLTPPDHP